MTDIQIPDLENKGPHNGRWIQTESGFVEISIFETGMPPRFRLYFYDFDGKIAPLPSVSDIRLETIRPSGTQQSFTFTKEQDYNGHISKSF